MQLYTFFPSACAYRVRIALALKSIDYEAVYVVGFHGSEKDCRNPGLWGEH